MTDMFHAPDINAGSDNDQPVSSHRPVMSNALPPSDEESTTDKEAAEDDDGDDVEDDDDSVKKMSRRQLMATVRD
jgi:hypothetical protein